MMEKNLTGLNSMAHSHAVIEDGDLKLYTQLKETITGYVALADFEMAELYNLLKDYYNKE